MRKNIVLVVCGLMLLVFTQGCGESGNDAGNTVTACPEGKCVCTKAAGVAFPDCVPKIGDSCKETCEQYRAS